MQKLCRGARWCQVVVRMTSFGERTKRCLGRAGWTPEYRNDPTDDSLILANRGLRTFPAWTDFVVKFGGLFLEFPHAKDPTSIDNAHLEPIVGAKGVTPQKLSLWEAVIGEPLMPVGECHRGYMILLISESGAIFEVMDRLVLRLGVSADEAIDSLCEGRDPEEVANR